MSITDNLPTPVCDEHRVTKDFGFYVPLCVAQDIEKRLASLRAENAALQKDINDLNNLLRAAGWGQGEIDSGACIEEENEKLRAELGQQQIYIAALEGYADSYALSRARAAVEATKGDIE